MAPAGDEKTPPPADRKHRVLSVALRKDYPPAFDIDEHLVLCAELPFQDRLRERIFDALLDRALERARAEHRIETGRRKLRKRRVRYLHRHVQPRQPLVEVLELDARDARDVLLVERVEHDDLVDAVDELRTEVGLDFGHHGKLDDLMIIACHLLDHLAAEVRCHDDDGVLEVDGASLPVCHAAVVEHLQQHVEHVRVRLLHLVEEDHAVGLAAHLLRQVATFLIAHIARRGADEAGNRVLFHEFAHVDADQVLFRIEQELGERLAELGLADAGRAQEQERAVRAVLVRKAGARAADRIRDEPHRLVLADDALVQPLFHLQQLLALALHHLADRNARRARHDFGDLLGADLGAQQLELALAAAGRFGRLQLRLELRELAVLQLGELVVLALPLHLGHLRAQRLDLFLDVLAALHARLLRAPDFVEVRVFALELVDLVADQHETLLRRLVGFPLHRFLLDLELDQATLELVHDFRL
ncbi:hypothetical protein ebB234 [Aromatoleum aromaticum EbN1]|uniref:Uncharacterized protein n=1 Tax=Aromatoleum aromaticum (strain DSM 19018 / LMG 30748 / EbN1) TaxID=76114 RepID=Q5NYD1_AROAE|nr:hypothetical protein ebB234 [Aromatoleum aromaticum EbN1]